MTDLGVALGDAIRDFVGEVGKPSQHQPGDPFFTVMRQAIIKAVGAWSGSTPTVSIAFPEDPPDVAIPDVKVLHPYVPQIGDTVWAARMGPDVLVVSKMRGTGDFLASGDPHQSPDLSSTSKGGSAGYNFYDQGGSNRFGLLSSGSTARLRYNGSSANDHLTVNGATGKVTVPNGQLAAQKGAAVSGGNLDSSGGDVTSSGAGNHIEQSTQVAGNADGGLILGGSTVGHSRAFEGSDNNLYVQSGSGGATIFRNAAANAYALLRLNQLGVATLSPNYAFDANGGYLYGQAIRGPWGGPGGGLFTRAGLNVVNGDWGSAVLWYNVDNSAGFSGPLGKSFAIDHPTKKGRYLVHCCVEGPEVAVYYRGTEKTTRGRKVVKLPSYFERLARPENRTVQVTQILDDEEDELAVLAATEVADGKFVVRSSVPSARFSWEVKAVRADVGELDVEPSQDLWMRQGNGPYTYLVPDYSVGEALMKFLNPTFRTLAELGELEHRALWEAHCEELRDGRLGLLREMVEGEMALLQDDALVASTIAGLAEAVEVADDDLRTLSGLLSLSGHDATPVAEEIDARRKARFDEGVDAVNERRAKLVDEAVERHRETIDAIHAEHDRMLVEDYRPRGHVPPGHQERIDRHVAARERLGLPPVWQPPKRPTLNDGIPALG